MGHAYLNRKYLNIASKLIEWATEQYTTDDKLKRPEKAVNSTAVCPFLKPSLASDHFQIAFHPEVNGADAQSIEELMISYITTFKKMPPYDDDNKKALLVVFPNIEPRHVTVLDQVHSQIKQSYVKAALMIAQFHQKCDATSVHNKRLKTQLCDWPLMAIRHMQRHDILFLKDNAEWFTLYNQFFGEHFKLEKEPLDYYHELYQNAKEEYFKK